MRFARRRLRAAPALALFISFASAPVGVVARQKAKARAKTPAASSQPNRQAEPESELARLRAQLVQATKDYKESVGKLLALYETDVKRADERVAKTKELYEAGLVSKRELEAEQASASAARARVAGLQAQLKGADEQIAETLVEAEAEEAAAKALAKSKALPRGGLIATTAYIRYGGTRSWSLSEAGTVEQFFAQRFGRPLPVSSFGQSPVHDRWGYDHHNAMDVGVSPDSAEGRALMEYLRGSGVPFTAFRFAIPGTATGPHIHVGRPSHKIAPR